MYLKIGDIKALLELHVETKHWDEVASYSFIKSIIDFHIFESDIFCLCDIFSLF